jgi:hypothetical protein
MEYDGLVAVLEEARRLVSRPDNDFSWSSWGDSEAALAELDGLIAELAAGVLADRATLDTIFAPTGPMQEVGLSSGWADAFLRLADRYDLEMARACRGG